MFSPTCHLACKIALKTSDFFVISGNAFCCFYLSFLIHNISQASYFSTDTLLIVFAICVMNYSIFRDTAGW